MNAPTTAHVRAGALLPAKVEPWSTLAKPDKPARPANQRYGHQDGERRARLRQSVGKPLDLLRTPAYGVWTWD